MADKTKTIFRNDPAQQRKELERALEMALDDAQMVDFDIAMNTIKLIKEIK